MSKGDKDARVLQDATGARYLTCLARLRGLREITLDALSAGRVSVAVDVFMERVEALPDLVDGQTRCVTCLRDLTPVKECTCL